MEGIRGDAHGHRSPGANLANKYGWKIGDKVPIASNIFPQQDGSKNWTFDLVGIYDGKDEEWQRSTNGGWINFAYFDEANQFGRGLAGVYIIRLSDPDRAAEVAGRSTDMFENSPDETKTQAEKDFNLGFFKQIGDIGLIVRWILFAVFFTLLLVVGNTIAQSVRERIPGARDPEDAGLQQRQRARLRARRGGRALRHRRAHRPGNCNAARCRDH